MNLNSILVIDLVKYIRWNPFGALNLLKKLYVTIDKNLNLQKITNNLN